MRSFVTLLLLFVFFNIHAQDVIVQKNGRKINCKILNADSVMITYTLPHYKGKLNIPRAEVDSYSIAEPANTRKIPAAEFPGTIGFFELSGGAAIPTGEFGSSDPDSETSGLALNGFLFSPSFILTPVPFVGISLSYRYQANPFDCVAIRDYLMSTYPGTTFSCTSGKWIVNGFFAGAYFTASLKSVKNLSLDLQLNLGFPKVEMPQVTTKATIRGQVVSVTQAASSVHALTGLIGAGFKYRVSETIALRFQAGYLSSKATYTGVPVYGTGLSTSFFDYSQKVTSVNIQAGICLLIVNKTKTIP
jgi:hypothetical protein